MRAASKKPRSLAYVLVLAVGGLAAAACGASEEEPFRTSYNGSTDGGGRCGDGVINFDEVCDGPDLGGETCATATLNARPVGQVRCSPFCTLDLSGCKGSQNSGGGGSGGGGGNVGNGATSGGGVFGGGGLSAN